MLNNFLETQRQRLKIEGLPKHLLKTDDYEFQTYMNTEPNDHSSWEMWLKGLLEVTQIQENMMSLWTYIFERLFSEQQIRQQPQQPQQLPL